jgi:hypothetical protein
MKKDFDFYLKWIACIVTLVGACCTAFKFVPVNIYIMNVGASLYLWWSWRIREWSLIVINAALVAIYVAGVAVDLFS